jgi:DNA-binding response OmpR family regulator
VTDINGSGTSGGTIVLVEDDALTALSVARILETIGFQVNTAESAADAKVLLRQVRPELILLDLMLPDGDGLVLLSTLRSLTEAPIIICSARGRQVDRVLGLKMGADDFLDKPFDVDELEARIGAVLRRAARGRDALRPAAERIQIGDLVVWPARASVTLGDRPVHLTPTEYRLLVALVNRPDEVLSREKLSQITWGYGDLTTGHLIDVHIGRLRQKLRRAAPAASAFIQTVRGRGFIVRAEPSEENEVEEVPA